MLDTVTVLAPSQTQTNRYGLIAGLRWDINDDHTVRVDYTFDRGRHRQTGEVGFLQINGEPFDVFPVNDPARRRPTATSCRSATAGRSRSLHQISGEYRGEFFDSRLTVNVGMRAPFFERDLNNNCVTVERQRLRRMLRPVRPMPRNATTIGAARPDHPGAAAARLQI